MWGVKQGRQRYELSCWGNDLIASGMNHECLFIFRQGFLSERIFFLHVESDLDPWRRRVTRLHDHQWVDRSFGAVHEPGGLRLFPAFGDAHEG